MQSRSVATRIAAWDVGISIKAHISSPKDSAAVRRLQFVPEGISGQQAALFRKPMEKPPHCMRQLQMDAWHPDMTLSHMLAARQIRPSATTA